MFEIIKPAILRALTYFAPLVLGAIFAWAAARGFGVYNEVAGTLTITLSIQAIVGYAAVFLAAPAVALTAIFKGWKPLGK